MGVEGGINPAAKLNWGQTEPKWEKRKSNRESGPLLDWISYLKETFSLIFLLASFSLPILLSSHRSPLIPNTTQMFPSWVFPRPPSFCAHPSLQSLRGQDQETPVPSTVSFSLFPTANIYCALNCVFGIVSNILQPSPHLILAVAL